MKKTSFVLGAITASLLFAASSFAACPTTGDYKDISAGLTVSLTLTDPAFIIKGSKNVCGKYLADTETTVDAVGQHYVICTTHGSGDKSFATSSDRQVILSTPSVGAKCTADSDFNTTAWTSL